MKEKRFSVYEDAIIRTLRKSPGPITPTEISRRLGIHPITAKNKILGLSKRGYVSCDREGKRLFCKLNLKKI